METFGLVDGPGVRFVVFLQGCAMRCKYCHNPETWSGQGGQEWSPEDLFKHVYRYKSYWHKKGQPNGGITVSGGEPLLQMPFVTEFFRLAKAKGVNTTLDTAGNPFTLKEPFISQFKELMKVTDLVMLDIKHMDAAEHRKLTGQDNEKILAFARYLDEKQIPVWIRHVVVPGITFQREELEALGRFLATLSNVEKLEVLPYHSMGKVKYDNLGIDYALKDTPQLTKAEAKSAESIILEAMRQARNV